MLHRLVVVLGLSGLLAVPLVAPAQIPAFPGAEGAGATTTGGRGQEVYHVTNLNESGPGSFVDALSQSNRIVVFDVSGVINLNTPDPSAGRNDHWFRTGVSNITIAGQTAPGNGIVIQGTGTKFTGSNVVLRNLNFRPGGTWNDQVRTMDGLWIEAQNSIFDHVSSAWASDEGISTTDIADNTTVQYSIMAEGLLDHSYGALVQVDTPNTVISYHHNLFTNNRSRNPRLGNKTGTVNVADFRNNVVYNWGAPAGYSTGGEEGDGNFVGNYYIAGPSTQSSSLNYAFSGGSPLTDLYQSGNKIDPTRDGVFNGTNTGWGMFTGTYVQHASPFAVPNITTQTADDALDTVLDFSGANWWNRTSTDTRLVSQVLSAGTAGSTIYDPAEVGGWPTEPIAYRPADWDVDGDGMPGYWELEHGLDPSVADDSGDFDADGYTNVEEYLNEIAEWPAPQPIVFNGATNNRYEQITNWDIKWQPSRYDEAQINGGTVTVDSVGQHAGTLKIGTNPGDNATLNITGGWLKVEDAGAGMSTGEVIIGADPGATAALNLSGGRLRTEKLSKGAGGSFSFTGGVLSADEVDFDLVSDGGTISPGESPGQTHVMGDLTINSGSLAIEIASALDFDKVLVDDSALVGGNLNVSLLGYIPVPSDVFEVLTADSLSGTFANAATTAVTGYGTFDVTYTSTSVLLSNFEIASLPGDYNQNGTIDAADYTVWRDAVTAGATELTNDPTPGTVDESDFMYWREHFRESLGGGSGQGAANVPEPASLSLAALCVVICLVFSGRTGRAQRVCG